MESETSRPMNINNYNPSNGKLSASIHWLITKIYEANDIPDNLRDVFCEDDEGNLELLPTIIKCLTSGSFYAQAASKVLKNNALVAQHIGAVLGALSSAGIDVREADGSLVTESALSSEEPFRLHSHLALIDSLMMAHLKVVISIDGVVSAVSAYTPVEKREEPLDCVDALLFWINKICLLVRDDVERSNIALKSNNQSDATIPEMEDLYEDLCDGTCVCVLASFYHPNEVPLERIYFNDPMSINDCRFNLTILKEFCATALPWNPFHFEIDDILYLHESLQPNVNVFLADLFYFFETPRPVIPQEPLVLPTQRRFIPIQGIPELRAQNIANRPQHPPKVNRFGNGASSGHRAASLASVDSLMTTRSGDSLRYPGVTHHTIGPNTTSFGEILQNQSTPIGNVEVNQDGIPISKRSTVEAKLQMSEMRRQLEMNKMIQDAAIEEKRNQMGKDAFFRVMSKSTTDDLKNPNDDSNSGGGGGYMTTSGGSGSVAMRQFHPATPSNEDILSTQVHNLQEQINSMKLNNSLTNDSSPTLHSTYRNDAMIRQPSSMGVGHYAQPLGMPPKQEYVQSPPGGQMMMMPGGSSFALNRIQQDQQIPSSTGYLQHGIEQSHYALPNTGNNSGTTFPATPAGVYGQQPMHPSFPMHHQFPPYHYHESPQGMVLSGGQSPYSMQNNNNYPVMNNSSPYQTQNFTMQSSISQPNALNILHHQGGFPQQQPYAHPQPPQQMPYYPNMQSPQIVGAGYPMQHHYTTPTQMFNNQPPQQMVMPQNMSYSESYAQHKSGLPEHGGILLQSQQGGCGEEPGNNDSVNNGGFHLHQPNASSSRLDPPLELNRNLTNWGLTYRAADRAPRKTWAKSAFLSEQDVSTPGSSRQTPAPDTNNRAQSPTLSSSTTNTTATTMNNNNNGKAENNRGESSISPPCQPDMHSALRSSNRAAGVQNSEARAPTARSSLFIADVAVGDAANPEMTPEMQAKRRALLSNQIKRKEKIVAVCEEKEMELAEKRQQELDRQERAEQRKLERELKRQKLLEEYKKKKMEQELGEPSTPGGSGSVSARAAASSSTMSLNRGHSQPPFARPKSQSNMGFAISRTLQRPGRTQSSVAEDENATPRISVPSTAEPALKLFAKHQPKSNRALIMNAIQYSIFPGTVTMEQKNKVQCAIAQSDSKHFLVLFRDHKCQYRGMYTWDQISDTVYRIDGTGPKICREDIMKLMFKYDSGAKHFNQIPTKHLSATIDGFTILDHFWQKAKIPHS